MKPFWTYVLRCADRSYYTGHSDDLERRMSQHESGAISTCYTFKRRPVVLVFSQTFERRVEALAAERQIKGWSRKKKEAMMRGDWAEVSRLARLSGGAVHPSTGSGRTESAEDHMEDMLTMVAIGSGAAPDKSIQQLESAIKKQLKNKTKK
ncbi:MAG: GIY-YIG nuclease family protein [Dokdonella sp.]